MAEGGTSQLPLTTKLIIPTNKVYIDCPRHNQIIILIITVYAFFFYYNNTGNQKSKRIIRFLCSKSKIQE